MGQYDSDFSEELISTRQVLDEVISESHSLYTQLRDDPKASAALKKRVLTLFTNATLKLLSRVQQLQESDGILTRIATSKPEHEVTNSAMAAIKAYIDSTKVPS